MLFGALFFLRVWTRVQDAGGKKKYSISTALKSDVRNSKCRLLLCLFFFIETQLKIIRILDFDGLKQILYTPVSDIFQRIV